MSWTDSITTTKLNNKYLTHRSNLHRFVDELCKLPRKEKGNCWWWILWPIETLVTDNEPIRILETGLWMQKLYMWDMIRSIFPHTMPTEIGDEYKESVRCSARFWWWCVLFIEGANTAIVIMSLSQISLKIHFKCCKSYIKDHLQIIVMLLVHLYLLKLNWKGKTIMKLNLLLHHGLSVNHVQASEVFIPDSK